jgi:hypothetical protein
MVNRVNTSMLLSGLRARLTAPLVTPSRSASDRQALCRHFLIERLFDGLHECRLALSSRQPFPRFSG